MSNEHHSPASPLEHVQRMVQDWYYARQSPPDDAGAGVWKPLPPDIITVQLPANWSPCDDAEGAEVQLGPGNVPQLTGRIVQLRDPYGFMLSSLLYNDQAGYMPSGVYARVIATFDGDSPDDGLGGYYEPLEFGTDLCNLGSGGGSGPQPQPECGVPCPPAGYSLQWAPLAGSSGCLVLIACPSPPGSTTSTICSDCTTCGSTRSATVAGVPAPVDFLNGGYTMTGAGTPCAYEADGGTAGPPVNDIQITVGGCTGGTWNLQVSIDYAGGGTNLWTGTAPSDGSGCPAAGTYTLAPDGGNTPAMNTSITLTL